jgi:hemerythrin-like domain-containing protein
MQATDTLKREHQMIERVLQLLEQSARLLQSHESLPDGLQAWTVDFLRRFADGCHHDKEERVLFPMLEERGVMRAGGPIGVMLREHEMGRDCVRRMAQALPGEDHDPAAFAAAADEYVALLRQHILKENQVLFPMADAVLSAADDATAMARFHAASVGRCECAHAKFETDLASWEHAIDR